MSHRVLLFGSAKYTNNLFNLKHLKLKIQVIKSNEFNGIKLTKLLK